MDESTIWWLITGLVIVAELATGTLYLLMIALGAAAGALAAHAGLTTESQLIWAALVAGLTVIAWYWRKKRHHLNDRHPLGSQVAPDLSLDLGQIVQVTQWAPDGSALLQYRGAPWQARLNRFSASTDPTPEPGTYRICALQGNILLLEKV